MNNWQSTKPILWRQGVRGAVVGWIVVLMVALAWPPGYSVAGMFPPLPAAKAFINFDGKGFIIHGKRVFLVSGSLQYARVPRGLWANRLRKMKRAGFNCVETYVFWNFQEPRRGQFDFKGRHNLQAFLTLVKKMGFYAILRVGPYDCAEWDSGGLPVWLRFIPGLAIREYNKPFITQLGLYFHKLLPLVAANQINRGGPVIMMQLENEDPQGWGAVLPNKYYKFMFAKARQEGIDVPLFFSGMHHGFSPAGVGPWNSSGRTSPWFTTEMWTGWFTQYGTPPQSNGGWFGPAKLTAVAMWRVIAYGGNGYNAYMAVGGTSFSHWNCRAVRASYDFAAPIGQGGDLRPLYYNYKAANYFARSFEKILEDSVNASAHYRSFAPRAAVYARQSPFGTLVFLSNFNNAPLTTVPRGGVPLTIMPNSVLPIVMDYPLNKTMMIRRLYGQTLGFLRQGKITTLVMYGSVGSQGMLQVRTVSPVGEALPAGFQRIGGKPRTLTLSVKFTAGAPQVFTLSVKGGTLRILAESSSAAKRTWFVNDHGRPWVIYGPQYVGAIHTTSHGFTMQTRERPGRHINFALAFGAVGTPLRFSGPPVAGAPHFAGASPPALLGWRVRLATTPAQPTFNDRQWLAVRRPKPMGADDYPGAYEWYRTNITVPAAGQFNMAMNPVKNYGEFFVNGRLIQIGSPRVISVPLKQGSNSLAVFTIDEGRPKNWGWIGSYGKVNARGLWGDVRLSLPHIASVKPVGWMITPLKISYAQALAAMPGGQLKPAWRKIVLQRGQLLCPPAVQWMQATLPGVAAAHMVLTFQHLPVNSAIFLNGRRVTLLSPQKGRLRLVLGGGWNVKADNTLGIVADNRSVRNIPIGPISVNEWDQSPALPQGGLIENWRMHGGIGPADPGQGWKPFTATPGVPAFYRTHFNYQPNTGGLHLVLRAAWAALGGGYMWINGHNLGRYPDPIMPMGLYLPSCWMKSGRNSLVIFDERGGDPRGVHLVIEQPACRRLVPLRSSRR
ncbi:MAG: beta-galactosidase [Phycisphaerae bacterium]